jgi:hypothetical protein
MTRTTQLRGLDGSTPLGFLAALGLLEVATREFGERGSATIAWQWNGTWTPVLSPALPPAELAAMVLRDRDQSLSGPILQFQYLKREKREVKRVGALTPPVAVLRAWLKNRVVEGDTHSLRHASGLMTELATDEIMEERRLGNEQLAAAGIAVDQRSSMARSGLQTAFDFTSRNAQFLEQMLEIGKELDTQTLQAELHEGQLTAAEGRSMAWDQGADAPGALYRAARGSRHPAAEWLAWRGLACFSVFGTGRAAATTSCTGRRKQGRFSWCVWEPPCSARVVASLLSAGIWRLQREDQRSALGIRAVFECQLTKAADGYGGVFSPTQVV